MFELHDHDGQHCDAVSPVLAVILLVAITVILSAAVGVFALDLGESVDNSGTADVGVSTNYDGEEYSATIITGDADAVELRVDGEVADSIDNPSAGDTLSAAVDATDRVTIVAESGGDRSVVTAGDAAPSSGPVAPSEGLVGYWMMDDDSDTSTATDSALDNHGNIGSGVSYTSTSRGTALEFSGSGDVGVPDDDSISPTGEVTVSTWVHFDSVSRSEPEALLRKNDAYILQKTSGSNGNVVAFAVWDGGSLTGWRDAAIPPETLDDGGWNHIVGVFDGEEYRIYHNGTLIDSHDTAATSIDDSSNTLHIGSRGGSQYWLHGQMDTSRVYDRALSGDEVEDLYESTK